jgi:uncharacterized delta-60 repeat protein
MRPRNAGTPKLARAGVVLAAMAAVALAAAGSLDPAFGTGGVAMIDAGGATGVGGIAVQTDGKTVECNWTDTGRTNEVGTRIWEWQIRRLDANGNLDTGFGSGGLVRLFGDTGGRSGPLSQLTPEQSHAREIVLDASGRTVTVGNSAIKTVTVTGTGKKQKTTYSWKQYATLARLNADGTLDTSFGSGGVVRTAVPGAANTLGKRVVLEPDGRIVIAGNAYFADNSRLGGYRTQTFVARYLDNGTLDPTLGTGGIIVDTRVTGLSYVSGVALQSGGRILVAHTLPPSKWSVTRFTSSGVLDTGFATIAAPDEIAGVAVDRFDRIVATGHTAGYAAVRVARYAPDGSADATFGAGGVVTISAYTRQLAQTRALFQPADDKIVFGGKVAGPVPAAFEAITVRLTDAGALDATYGSGGWSASIVDGWNGFAIALAPDGAIILGGNMPGSSLFVARYAGN